MRAARMTLQNPLCRQNEPFAESEPLKRDKTVLRACGLETARSGEKGGDCHTVHFDEEDGQLCRQTLHDRQYTMHAISLLFHFGANQRLTSEQHFTILDLENIPLRDKNHIVARPWTPEVADDGPHATLCGITPDGIPILLARNKSNTTPGAVPIFISFDKKRD